MEDWDLTSVGMVLIGSSLTAAGTIIAAMLLGVKLANAPFLLLTTAFLIVMSAALMMFGKKNDAPPT
jgi:hypothetical protein